LLFGGWVILTHGTIPPGLGSDILIVALGFGFIPDLVDGSGAGSRGPEHLSDLDSEIRNLLDGLGEDFLVLHDVDSPHGTIRHIVISRGAGVFLIGAKPERSRGGLEGRIPEDDTRESGHHGVDQYTATTRWLRDRITEIVGEKPWITPLLVVPNAFVPKGIKLDGVRVLDKASLIPTLSETRGRRRKSNLIWEARTLIADSLAG
jgi:hypothetical protein